MINHRNVKKEALFYLIMKRGVAFVLILSFIIILSISFTSANIFSDLWNKITGKVSLYPTNSTCGNGVLDTGELCDYAANDTINNPYGAQCSTNCWVNGAPPYWSGCRGSGAHVCTDNSSITNQYFIDHPNCIKNPTCGGVYYNCNGIICPQPNSTEIVSSANQTSCTIPYYGPNGDAHYQNYCTNDTINWTPSYSGTNMIKLICSGTGIGAGLYTCPSGCVNGTGASCYPGVPASPYIFLTPVSGPPGTIVNINGTNYPSNINISIFMGGIYPSNVFLSAVTTDPRGRFITNFTIPNNLSYGISVIVLAIQQLNNSNSTTAATFTITPQNNQTNQNITALGIYTVQVGDNINVNGVSAKITQIAPGQLYNAPTIAAVKIEDTNPQNCILTAGSGCGFYCSLNSCSITIMINSINVNTASITISASANNTNSNITRIGACQTNSDCSFGVCVSGQCVVYSQQNQTTPVCDGCKTDRCYPFGYRKNSQYCSAASFSFVTQLGTGAACQNSFECGSNLCISNQCVSPSLIQSILNWFKKLFGFS